MNLFTERELSNAKLLKICSLVILSDVAVLGQMCLSLMEGDWMNMVPFLHRRHLDVVFIYVPEKSIWGEEPRITE